MINNKSKILIFGLGYFEQELIKLISKNWGVVAVDQDETKIGKAREKLPDVEFIRGDVSSILTWKAIDLTGVRHLISTIRDRDVNLEVCRIAREVKKLKLPIMVLVYEDIDEYEALLEPYDVTLIKPVELGLQLIQKRLDKNISQAINLGLGKGELIEVHVQSRSHLVNRKLKYLKPSQWHISAIYRQNELIIPTGNCRIQLGDRVVLVGDPRILGNVADIFIKGSPQFPLQYGTDVVFPLHRDFEEYLDEAVYWLNTFKAMRIYFVPFKKNLPPNMTGKIKEIIKSFQVGDPIEVLKEIFEQPLNTGVMFLPSRKRWFQPCRARLAFKNSLKPFIIACNIKKYTGIITSLNGPDPALALDTAIEISRMAKIPFQAIFVTMPREMRGAEEDKMLKKREEIIGDFESIHQESIPYHVLEGNPVLATKSFLGSFQNHLVVLTHSPGTPVSRLKPNVSFMVAKSTHLSTLVIPVVDANEA